MKKFAHLLLAGIVAFGLIGCGEDDSTVTIKLVYDESVTDDNNVTFTKGDIDFAFAEDDSLSLTWYKASDGDATLAFSSSFIVPEEDYMYNYGVKGEGGEIDLDAPAGEYDFNCGVYFSGDEYNIYDCSNFNTGARGLIVIPTIDVNVSVGEIYNDYYELQNNDDLVKLYGAEPEEWTVDYVYFNLSSYATSPTLYEENVINYTKR